MLMVGGARLLVDRVAHRFAGTGWLFEDLSLDVGPGEVLAVTGPSGCGKSTLLSIMAGWLTPTRGTVRREGIGRTAWVFQNPHGVARRTAVDHVSYPLLAQGARRREAEGRAREILDQFELAEVADREFRALSGGEAQRLMLARAVAVSPGLLLVDEPTAQLDRSMAASVSATLCVLAGQSMIVVIATHDPAVREQSTLVSYLPGARAASGGPDGAPHAS